MPWLFHEQREFFRQFREQFHETGAVAPSSRFLARALTGPLCRRTKRPARILEVGPGTGAVTRSIVELLQPGDHLDLVELNPRFVEILQERFLNGIPASAQAARIAVHQCPLQEFSGEGGYDYIISGLPLNNFSPSLVREIFEAYFRLLAPQGVLSYFEYMYVRSLRQTLSLDGSQRQRLRELDAIIGPHLQEHRIHRDWVFVNLPPAWVQHLQPQDPRSAVAAAPSGESHKPPRS